MRGISNPFRGLADVLETIETNRVEETRIHISSVTPLSQDVLTSDTIRTELEIRVPLFDSKICGTHSKLTAEDAQLTDDGSLLVEFLITAESNEQTSGEDDSTESQLENEDSCESKFDETDLDDTDNPESEGNTASPESTPDSDGEIPAYRNPDRLREVYETHDTFTEMTDALEVDVTPQTVRRYMIKHSIHEPASNTGSQTVERLLDADPESISASGKEKTIENTEPIDEPTRQPETQREADENVVSTDGHGGISDEVLESEVRTGEVAEPTDTVTDDEQRESETNTGNITTLTKETEEQSIEKNPPSTGDVVDVQPDSDDIETDVATKIGDNLPDHLTLDDIKSTVQSAKTLYEAQRQLDLDREEARALFQDLNLLDLVHGRVTTQDLTDRTIEDINRRLRATVAANQEQD